MLSKWQVKKIGKRMISSLSPMTNLVYTSGKKNVCLTFDDGPHPKWTPLIMDILREENLKAVFFTCGFRLEQSGDALRILSEHGHQIGNHSYSHHHFGSTDVEIFKKDFLKYDQLITEITRKKTHLYRPPYGEYSFKQWKWLKTCGYKTVLWSIDLIPLMRELNNDLDTLSDHIDQGDIILMHDDSEQDVRVLPDLIRLLRKKGIGIGTIPE